ncbi:MAG: hypothetical protein LBI69_00560, partial [Puniceicoccales bacterium]|nr:hypothetical protein [Puniceicoccales bacterium]
MSGATNSIVNQHGGQPTITKKVNLSDGAPLPPDNSIASGSSRTTSSPWVRLLTAVAFTLLSAALAAGIAIAVMIFLLEMPIALGIVAIVALGAASLTAGGIALYNFFSGESDKNIPLIENPDTNDLSQKSQDSIQSEENQDSIQTGNDPSAIIPKNIINQD